MTKRPQNPVPDWVIDETQEARRKFGIDDGWHIYLEWAQTPGGNRESNGECTTNSVYLDATIQLRNKLEPGQLASRVILHEVGHVALAEIDRLIEGYVLPAIFDEAQRETLRAMYIDAVERFLQRLVRGLVG